MAPSQPDHGHEPASLSPTVLRARSRRALGPLADLRIILFLSQLSCRGPARNPIRTRLHKIGTGHRPHGAEIDLWHGPIHQRATGRANFSAPPAGGGNVWLGGAQRAVQPRNWLLLFVVRLGLQWLRAGPRLDADHARERQLVSRGPTRSGHWPDWHRIPTRRRVDVRHRRLGGRAVRLARSALRAGGAADPHWSSHAPVPARNAGEQRARFQPSVRQDRRDWVETNHWQFRRQHLAYPLESRPLAGGRIALFARCVSVRVHRLGRDAVEGRGGR